MSELAINLVPVMTVAGKVLGMAFKAVVALVMGAWAIWWGRAIYRTVFKK